MAKASLPNPKLRDFLGSDLHQELEHKSFETFRKDAGQTYFPDLKKQLFTYIRENKDFYTDEFLSMAYVWVGEM